MPSYEPTPRRFSTISVSRTSSRRDSIDATPRPSLAVSNAPVFPLLTSPLDLAGASEHFKETVDAEGETERGRPRQSAHRRSVTAWTHDVGIKLPFAKRNTSASTRDRIVMWEERSRSQSKGRSKSRGRDLGLGTRISVVPEMPELPAGLSGLGKPEKFEEGESSKITEKEPRDVSGTLQRFEGVGFGEPPIFDDPPSPENTQLAQDEALHNSIYESLNDKDDEIRSDDRQPADKFHIPHQIDDDKENWASQQFRDDIKTWARQVTHSPPQSRQGDLDPNSGHYHGKDNLDHSDHERAHTPVGTTPPLLPTPDSTPRKVYSRGSNEWVDREIGMPASSLSDMVGIEDVHDNKDINVSDALEDTPERPSTPVKRVNLPLTPDAIQMEKFTRNDADFAPDNTTDRLVSPREKSTTDPLSGVDESPPMNQPAPLDKSEPQTKLAESPVIIENSHLPSEISPMATTDGMKVETEEIEADFKLPHRPTPSTKKSDQSDGHYRDVWNITDYAPEFPFPARPRGQATLEHAISHFDGSPLQEPPKSQLSAAAAAYRPPLESITPVPAGKIIEYSYPSFGTAVEGDWAVDIPPSPTSAYHRVADDHSPARQPKPRSRTKSKGGRNGGGGSSRLTSRGEDPAVRERYEWDAPPVFERALHAASVGIFQGLAVPMGVYRGFRDIYYPPPERPDIIKAYPIRRRLPVR